MKLMYAKAGKVGNGKFLHSYTIYVQLFFHNRKNDENIFKSNLHLIGKVRINSKQHTIKLFPGLSIGFRFK